MWLIALDLYNCVQRDRTRVAVLCAVYVHQCTRSTIGNKLIIKQNIGHEDKPRCPISNGHTACLKSFNRFRHFNCDHCNSRCRYASKWIIAISAVGPLYGSFRGWATMEEMAALIRKPFSKPTRIRPHYSPRIIAYIRRRCNQRYFRYITGYRYNLQIGCRSFQPALRPQTK